MSELMQPGGEGVDAGTPIETLVESGRLLPDYAKMIIAAGFQSVEEYTAAQEVYWATSGDPKQVDPRMLQVAIESNRLWRYQ